MVRFFNIRRWLSCERKLALWRWLYELLSFVFSLMIGEAVVCWFIQWQLGSFPLLGAVSFLGATLVGMAIGLVFGIPWSLLFTWNPTGESGSAADYVSTRNSITARILKGTLPGRVILLFRWIVRKHAICSVSA